MRRRYCPRPARQSANLPLSPLLPLCFECRHRMMMITMIAHVAWTPDSPMNSFRLNDSFDGLEATPGFTVALADLFAWPSTGGQGLVAGSRRRRQACQRTGARHQGALGLPVNLLVGQGREWCLEQRRHMRQPGVTQEGLHALQGDCSLAQPCVHIAMAGKRRA